MIGFWADFFTFLQVAVGLFLIFIIMLQRGKGGGLVGALGGMGGASAFGPKADIQVLKLTIGLAIAWVVVACGGIFFNRAYAPSKYQGALGDPTSNAKGEGKDKDDKKAGEKDATSTDSKDSKKEGATKDGDKSESKTPKADDKPAAAAGSKKAAVKAEAEDTPAKPAANAKKSEPVEKPAAEKPAAEKSEAEKPEAEKPAAEKP